MPELPDIEDYLAALRPRVRGSLLQAVRITGFSVLKTFDPPLEATHGQTVVALSRLGKRLVFELSPDDAVLPPPDQQLFLVLHLMVAGRLAWKDTPGAPVPKKVGLAAFDFSSGTLLLREASTKKRASLHVLRGRDALAAHDRGGIDPLTSDLAAFTAALTMQNRTVKRALTDPRVLSGIGNAYSDEILLHAGLSPVRHTHKLDDAELARLHATTQRVLQEWTDRLRAETGEGFPGNVTAFRDDFAAHGRYGKPCPVCATPIQRIRYADNETNYCPTCQNGGRVLADRSLSRLLKDDWPRTVDELEGA